MPPKISVNIAGREFSNWTSIQVHKSLDSAAWSFELECLDTWTKTMSPWPFYEGDPCTIMIDHTPYLEGYIDQIFTHFSGHDHYIQIAGRDAIADLVDCAYVGTSDEFKGRQSLLEIASQMTRPFDLKVSSMAGVLPLLENWKVDPGESVFETLERAARKCQVLLQSNGRRGLEIVRVDPKPSGVALIEGVNIEASSARYDHSNRFSNYIVKGSSKGNASVKNETKDTGVKRYRPYIVLAEGEINEQDAKKRAEWESTIRAARSMEIYITTNNWQNDQGSLWDVNALVHVFSPRSRVYGEDLLIRDVHFCLDEFSGTSAELTLTRPDAYQAPIANKTEKTDGDKELLKKMGYL